MGTTGNPDTSTYRDAATGTESCMPTGDRQGETEGQPLHTSARSLHPSAGAGRPLAVETLSAIAEGLSAVADADASADPGTVVRTRLLDTTSYDVWQIVWGAHASAEDHDHAGSIGVLRLVRGGLTETVHDIDGHPVATHEVPTEGTSALSISGRHSLANASDGVAISVHVYSPPLGDPDLGHPAVH